MNLLVRADADARIGTGHVMRCLALSQAWQDRGGKVVFSMAPWLRALETRLCKEGIDVVRPSAEPGSPDDARQTAELARQKGADCVAIDGYHFASEYQRILKTTCPFLLFLDDNGHASHYAADIVLNQNIYASEALYKSKEPYTRLMLGPQYALLRKEFWKWRDWKRTVPDVARKILVTVGGGDPDNVVYDVMNWLERVDVNGLEINVIAGATNPHFEALQAAARSSRHTIHLEKNISNMPHRMAQADLAVSAAGTICLELAFMALPTCTIVVAENQVLNALTFHERGDTVNLGQLEAIDEKKAAQLINELILSKERRSEMSFHLRLHVDGFGAERVVEAISGYTHH